LFDIRETSEISKNRDCPGILRRYGPALVRAKQAYYANHGWFDHLHEKVLLPVTLYGLPMLRVSTPDTPSQAFGPRPAMAGLGSPDAAQSTAGLAMTTGSAAVTYTLSGLTFARHELDGGMYYGRTMGPIETDDRVYGLDDDQGHDYGGQVIVQEGLPIQPAWRVPLSVTLGDRTIRGVLLRSATYAEEASFDPLIAQSWAVGEARSAVTVGAPVAPAGWDRQLPYALVHFEGLTERLAVLHLVLGAYDGDRGTERLFDGLVLEALYGNGDDDAAPTVSAAQWQQTDGQTLFEVFVSDDVETTRVIIVYDDGEGHWHSLALTPSGGGMWAGQTLDPVTHFYVQAADAGGNVAVSDWMQPTNEDTVYLPLVICGEP
jgi:hypothetical protein